MREIKFRAWHKKDNTMYNKGWYDDLLLGEDIGNKYLMQYTGLKDKKGVEIYEGDIVKTISRDNMVGVVEYWKDRFIIRRVNKAQNISLLSTDLEIIGNIYENLELLQEKA